MIWALMFMKVYVKEDAMLALTGVYPKALHKHTKLFIDAI